MKKLFTYMVCGAVTVLAAPSCDTGAHKADGMSLEMELKASPFNKKASTVSRTAPHIQRPAKRPTVSFSPISSLPSAEFTAA